MMLTRLARWWLNRSKPPQHLHVGECICGAKVSGEDLHLIVSVSDDDGVLGIDGQTAMSADFCERHCPGGCSLGCANMNV